MYVLNAIHFFNREDDRYQAMLSLAKTMIRLTVSNKADAEFVMSKFRNIYEELLMRLNNSEDRDPVGIDLRDKLVSKSC